MAMMTSTTTSVTPDKRGGHRCLCHGTFLGMQRTSGWIRPVQEINHAAAEWNQGDVYVSEKDIFPGVTPEEGDSVVFYLYADGKGLGAESCVQVWHSQAQAMKSAVAGKGVSFASALMAMTTLLAAQTPAANPPAAPLCAVDLSSFYDDDDTDDDSDSDAADEVGAKPTTISLADILPAPTPQEPPSVGSASHDVGGCRPCSFFPKGTCTNGGDCEFCHYAHEKKPRPKNKTKRARERQQVRVERVAGAKRDVIKLAPEEMPMKCAISPFLTTLTKDIFQQSKEGSQSPTTCSNIDEGSDDGKSDSSSWGSPFALERDVPISSPPGLEREPCFSPPPGLALPPPDFPPPPMPEYLAVGSD